MPTINYSQKSKKLKTALLSIAVTVFLITIKLFFGFFTNSISILASAVDSFLDLSASSVNYFSIKKSEKPADKEHKFGHGKAEGLAGLFQSFAIGLSAMYLIYISIQRLITEDTILQSLDLGILVIGLSLLISRFLAKYIKQVAEETDSIALAADSLHFKADVYTNFAIIAGLISIRITGLVSIDSIVSICVAIYIIYSTVSVLKEAIDILMDRELPNETLEEIKRTILNYQPRVKSFHKMRTRRSGNEKFIEFHLVVDSALSFVESHELAEDIIKEIENKIPNSDVTVHVDPHQVPDYS